MAVIFLFYKALRNRNIGHYALILTFNFFTSPVFVCVHVCIYIDILIFISNSYFYCEKSFVFQRDFCARVKFKMKTVCTRFFSFSDTDIGTTGVCYIAFLRNTVCFLFIRFVFILLIILQSFAPFDAFCLM